MAFAWACCLAVLLWAVNLLLGLAGMKLDLLLGLAGMEDTQMMRGVSFEAALRVVVEVAPAGTIAAVAVAADTGKTVEQVGEGLLGMVLVVEPSGTCLVGGFDIVGQKAYTDSVGAEALQVD